MEKYENHGMDCSPPQNQKVEKNLRDPTKINFPHFLKTLGCFDVKCAQLRVVELITVYALGSVRTHVWPYAGAVYGV